MSFSRKEVTYAPIGKRIVIRNNFVRRVDILNAHFRREISSIQQYEYSQANLISSFINNMDK